MWRTSRHGESHPSTRPALKRMIVHTLPEFQEPSKSLQTGKISSQSKYDAAYGLAGAEFDVVALDDVISPMEPFRQPPDRSSITW